MRLSALTGDGMEEWVDWIVERARAKRESLT
jgi:hypothetical protein